MVTGSRLEDRHSAERSAAVERSAVDDILVVDTEAERNLDLFFDSLSRVGERWNTRIMLAIGERTWRFGMLKRHIPGITQRMLTRSLRSLERDGLVQRTPSGDKVVCVDYNLTPLGRSALVVLHAIFDWAVQHNDDVASARRAFDARD